MTTKKILASLAIAGIAATAIPATASAAMSVREIKQTKASVRVLHASPDAPAVDVWVNDARALRNVKFGVNSRYLHVDAGTYRIRVVPAGATSPAVIDANVTVVRGKAYTVVASGKLSAISPLIYGDSRATLRHGKAQVRFIHQSPDAPAVDVAVKNGPVLFESVKFTSPTKYLLVDAGIYDLEVRLAGTTTVVKALDNVNLRNGHAYSAYAIGLAAGSPNLAGKILVDG